MRSTKALAVMAVLLSSYIAYAVDTVSAALPVSGDGAIISNGSIIIGVDNAGQLGVPYREVPGLLPDTDPAGIGYVALRDGSGSITGAEHGCLCEGWGIGVDTNGNGVIDSGDVRGWVNNDAGFYNVEVESFTGTDGGTTAISSVIVRDDAGDPMLRIVHEFSPSASTPYLYEVKVTVENLTSTTLGSVVYRRNVDWDVDPTPFREFVTIQGVGSTVRLINSGDNGFISSDPQVSNFEIMPGTFRTNFIDFGPDDHGAVFDLQLGPINPGKKVTLKMFYGAAPTTSDALNAINSVGANIYSIAKSSTPDDLPNNDSTVFILGFAVTTIGRSVGLVIDESTIQLNQSNTLICLVEPAAIATGTITVTDPLGNTYTIPVTLTTLGDINNNGILDNSVTVIYPDDFPGATTNTVGEYWVECYVEGDRFRGMFNIPFNVVPEWIVGPIAGMITSFMGLILYKRWRR